MAAPGQHVLTILCSEETSVVAYGFPCRGLRLDLRENFLAEQGISAPRDSRGPASHGLPCSAGHRQKLEDQTKAFPDRFGDLERLRMRVTPSTPSPRGSLSTTSHFSSQAQTPIQGTAQGGGGCGGRRGRGPGSGLSAPDQKLMPGSLAAPPWCLL